MSTALMSSEQESRFIEAVKSAIRLSNKGMDPSDAIAKTAGDYGYGKPFVSRMVEAFNVSKVSKHRKEASGEAKVASFPLADVDRVLSLMYPDKAPEAPATKTASAWVPTGANYVETRIFNLENEPKLSSRPARSSAAPDMGVMLKRAYDEMDRCDHAVAVCRDEVRACREHLVLSIQKAADYFKQLYHEPFERVEAALIKHWGDSGKQLGNVLWKESGLALRPRSDKRASIGRRVRMSERTPYVLVDNVMQCRGQFKEAAAAYAAAVKKASDYRAKLSAKMARLRKYADLLPTLVGANILSKMTGGDKSEASTADIMSGASEAALPPEYQAEHNAITAQLMLKDFLANDTVLRQADPVSVVQAYNEIASVAPRAATNPMVMRGLLRKAVEAGSYDPFDLANLVTLESGIKKRDEPAGQRSMPGRVK